MLAHKKAIQQTKIASRENRKPSLTPAKPASEARLTPAKPAAESYVTGIAPTQAELWAALITGAVTGAAAAAAGLGPRGVAVGVFIGSLIVDPPKSEKAFVTRAICTGAAVYLGGKPPFV